MPISLCLWLLWSALTLANPIAAAATVSGRVTDAAGHGLGGVQVVATNGQCGGGNHANGATDANGDYALSIAAGPVYVMASQGHDFNDTRNVWWNAQGGAHVCDYAGAVALPAAGIDLVLAPPGFPSLVASAPPDGAAGVPVDQPIVMQFDRSMATDCQVGLEDPFGNPEIDGTVTWSQRVYPHDTLSFVPAGGPLHHSLDYYLNYFCKDTYGVQVGGDYWIRGLYLRFSTAGASGDASAPRVTSTAPYDGQTGGIRLPIWVLFDKPIDAATVQPQSVQLTGPGAPGYRLEVDSFALKIWPLGLQTQAQYQVTLTSALADAEGHGLATPYSFRFNTGTGDTTTPTVVQTRPADQAPGLTWEPISVFFSERMDPERIDPTTVRVYDETAGGVQVGITIDKRWVHQDDPPATHIRISRTIGEGWRWQSGHTYRVVLDHRLTDLAGNPFGSDRVFRFTAVDNPNSQTLPPIMMGEGDSQAFRHPDGRVTVELEVLAGSSVASGAAVDVDVVDLTQPGKRWDNLAGTGWWTYGYRTPDGADEGLTPGRHDLLITVTEPTNGQTRTLLWSIHVFNATPLPNPHPAQGATGIPLQPTLGFTTNGLAGATAYGISIIDDATDAVVDRMWMFADAGTAYSHQVPFSRALEPNKTYRWLVVALEPGGWPVGYALTEERTFTTGAGSTDCQSGTLTLVGTQFGAGTHERAAGTAIVTQGSVQLLTGAQVRFRAPLHRYGPGFRVAAGARLEARAEAVTCPAASGYQAAPQASAPATVSAALSPAVAPLAVARADDLPAWLQALLAARGVDRAALAHALLDRQGQWLVFETAQPLHPTDGNGTSDVYRLDLTSGTLALLSRTPQGKAANGPSGWAAADALGDWVVFQSAASDLVSDDANGLGDIFLHEVPFGTTRRIATDGAAAHPALDAAGQDLLYDQEQADGRRQVIADGLWGGTAAPPLGPSDAADGRDRHHPALSADGRYVVWLETPAAASGDRAGCQVQVHDRDRGLDQHLACPESLAAASETARPRFSDDGAQVEWSLAGEAVPVAVDNPLWEAAVGAGW